MNDLPSLANKPTLTNKLGTIASKLFATTSAGEFGALLEEFRAAVRAQAITAAIAELRKHDGDDWWWDTRDRDAAIGLLAAMTATAPSTVES